MDFKVDAIREVIKEIGCTMVEIDTELVYLTRSFCVFEVLATVEGGAKLLVAVGEKLSGKAKMESALLARPVDSAAATSLNTEDKQQIDDFVAASVGFEALNTAITQAFIDGAETRTVYFRNM
jgi:hypothetical protein